jgi:hypothetical protein
MSRLPLLVAVALAAAPPLAHAQAAAGPVVALSLAGGGELGLVSSFDKGVGELALLGGWELGTLGLRPELSIALGVAPDGNVALRPGISWSPPEFPFRARLALDASNARDRKLHWRWLMIGGAAELRLTGRLSFDAGVDLGIPLGDNIGLPVLLRVGSTLRF